MRISIVTISYNQARFLEQAICSVINQDYPDIEYIVVDPGSTDSSREIIEKYRDQIDKIIFEPDEGPADGLNKGFSNATGEIFGFINADDYLMPGAVNIIVQAFKSKLSKDVISGNTYIVDQNGTILRKFYSRKFTPLRAVYGAATLAQQSTFFRSMYFQKAGGFNKANQIAWDGELWIDLALVGAQFGRTDSFLGAFRIYSESISFSKHRSERYKEYKNVIFEKVRGKKYGNSDHIVKFYFKFLEYIEHPKLLVERLRHGRSIKLMTK